MQSNILEASKAQDGVGDKDRALANIIADRHLVRRHLAPDSRPEGPVKDFVGRGLHGGAVPGVVPIAAPSPISSSNLDETSPLLKAEDCGAPVGETTNAGPRGHVSRRFALTLFVVVAGLVVCTFSILPLSLDG